MKNIKHNLLVLIGLILISGLYSCNRLDVLGMVVNRSDTEERVADWLDWDNQHNPFVIDSVADTYRFYSCSDVHHNDDNSRLTAYITEERNDPQAVFSIIAGDIANESGEQPYILCEEAMTFHPALQTKNDPCYPIIGNHDVYYNCADFFKQHFHTSTYTVTVKTLGGYQDLFVFLDSGNGTHGSRQLEWLEQQLAHRSNYRHCFVISHNWLFRTNYNYTTTPAANLPEDEQYAFMDLMSRNNVEMVVMGHFHYRDVKRFNGVTYVMTDNFNDGGTTPSYMVFTVGEQINYEYKTLQIQ